MIPLPLFYLNYNHKNVQPKTMKHKVHYVHSILAIILMGKSELVALPGLSSWCLVIGVWLFLAVPWVFVQFVIVVFPDHTHLIFLILFLILFSNELHQPINNLSNNKVIGCHLRISLLAHSTYNLGPL